MPECSKGQALNCLLAKGTTCNCACQGANHGRLRRKWERQALEKKGGTPSPIVRPPSEPCHHTPAD